MRTRHPATRVVCLVLVLTILCTPLFAAPRHAAPASAQAALVRGFDPPEREVPFIQRLLNKLRKFIGGTNGDEISIPHP